MVGFSKRSNDLSVSIKSGNSYTGEHRLASQEISFMERGMFNKVIHIKSVKIIGWDREKLY